MIILFLIDSIQFSLKIGINNRNGVKTEFWVKRSKRYMTCEISDVEVVVVVVVVYKYYYHYHHNYQ